MMQSSFIFSVCCLSRFVRNRLRIIIRSFLHKFYHLIYIMSNFVATKDINNQITNIDIHH